MPEAEQSVTRMFLITLVTEPKEDNKYQNPRTGTLNRKRKKDKWLSVRVRWPVGFATKLSPPYHSFGNNGQECGPCSYGCRVKQSTLDLDDKQLTQNGK